MATPGRLPFRPHPFLTAFPMMTEAEIDDLADDIRQGGLLHPITLTADRKTLVDGRCRYLACQRAGIAPTFETLSAWYTDRMIVDHIMAANYYRDHNKRAVEPAAA